MASSTITVNITGDTANLQAAAKRAAAQLRGISDQAGKTSKGMGGSFSRMGKAIAGVAGGIAVANIGGRILDFGKQSVAAFQESAAAAAQTNAVLKSTGGIAGVTAKQVDKLTSRIQDMSPITDEAARAGTNMLLTFTKVRNEAGKGNDVFNQATQTLADLSTATGTDMKTSAVQLGKALNDPIKGIGALTRVGVTFDEAQKRQIKRFVEAGNVAGAQKIILAELNKEFGGSAKAAGDAEGPLGKLKDRFQELQESIGQKILPVLGRLADFILTKVVPAVQRAFAGAIAFLRRKFEENREGLTTFFNALRTIATFIVTKVVPVIGGVLVRGIGAAITAIATIATAITTAFNFIKTAVRTVVNIVLGALGLIVDGAATAFGWIPGIGPKLKTAAAKFRTFRDQVNTALGGIESLAVGANVRVTAVRFSKEDGVPGLKHGGTVAQTGLAVVHKGETYSGVGGSKGGGDVVLQIDGQTFARIARDQLLKMKSSGRVVSLGLT